MASNSDPVMSAAAEIRQRLARPDGVRRVGQALWMMVGEPMQPSRLLWARGHLGPRGDELLWQALEEEHCFEGEQLLLEPQMLSKFLCAVWRESDDQRPVQELVWTLPSALRVEGIEPDGYVREAVRLISGAKQRVLIVSPYLEPKGIGQLQAPLLEALGRGVDVTLVAHDVEDLTSLASAALEPLRRESRGSAGGLAVYSALAIAEVLLHLKVVAVDGIAAVVGSANVTGKGFGKNLEAGASLGAGAAREVETVIQSVIAQGFVALAYSR